LQYIVLCLLTFATSFPVQRNERRYQCEESTRNEMRQDYGRSIGIAAVQFIERVIEVLGLDWSFPEQKTSLSVKTVRSILL